ncbi:CYFA0S11e03488g1_1 [Cyberlindnera fabianii]|uniref:CYFA0S11e03488g1_1 n=1 Tax=Cyberlindnera fabianii TaxID=36022 RepID=A0A061B1D4_CYBFA|nr:CYFA0S11e03488g1_1 [Cyberlindnera fabianii]
MANNNNPRPNLPSLLDVPQAKTDSTGGIRLPPISFLNPGNPLGPPQLGGVARLLSDPPKEGGSLPSLQPLSQLNSASSPPQSSSPPSTSITGKPFPFSTPAAPAPLPLKEEITKPDVDSESDQDIIAYYEKKFSITDFTEEEKLDIVKHERRARIEKAKNPNYRTYLCYSIIKRLNAMKDPKKTEPKTEEPVATPMPPLQPPPTKSVSPASEQNQTAQDAAPSTTHLPPDNVTAAVDTTINADATVQVVEPVEEKSKFVKREVIINSSDVLDFAAKFPRRHIGSILYTPFPTKAGYKQLNITDPLEGIESLHESKKDDNKIVPLLPELRDHINSIVTVRVPSWQITELQNNKHYQERAIWGTDIYTDDSDILLILKHNGFLPQVDPELEGEEKTMEKRTPGNKDNISNITQSVTNFRQFVNIIGGDVHVDLIVLPPLVEYAGTFRNGINSRAWKGHDGMSLAIYGVRYGEKGSAVESTNDISVKKRKLAEIEALRDSDAANQGDWKLNKEAWKKAKMEMELEKNKTKDGQEKNKADQS